MKSHKNIGRIVKEKRLSLPQQVSEVELSRRLNCEESFIADVEKGLRSVHPKMINSLCNELGAYPEEIVEAILMDKRESGRSKDDGRGVKGLTGKKFSVDLSQ